MFLRKLSEIKKSSNQPNKWPTNQSSKQTNNIQLINKPNIKQAPTLWSGLWRDAGMHCAFMWHRLWSVGESCVLHLSRDLNPSFLRLFCLVKYVFSVAPVVWSWWEYIHYRAAGIWPPGNETKLISVAVCVRPVLNINSFLSGTCELHTTTSKCRQCRANKVIGQTAWSFQANFLVDFWPLS